MVERLAIDDAIILHSGGDEFVFLIPNLTPERIILLIYEIQKGLDAHDFKVDELAISLSAGVSHSRLTEKTSFDELLVDADYALKKYAKITRNCLRFTVPDSKNPLLDKNINPDLITSIVKSSLGFKYTFANVWLNCISLLVKKTLLANNDFNQIDSEISHFINWTKINFKQIFKSSITRKQSLDIQPNLSEIDCCVSILDGIYRTQFSSTQKISEKIKIKYNEKHSSAAVFTNSKRIWGAQNKLSEIFDIGDFWYNPSKLDKIGSTSCVILIKIGNDPLPIIDGLFSEIIVVDDRPTSSGGLPDFWEATIARLVGVLETHPNVDSVIIYGNEKNANLTVTKLKKISSWSQQLEYFSNKTGQSTKAIQNSITRIQDDMFFISDKNEFLSILSKRFKKSRSWKLKSILNLPSSKFLTRNLDMQNYALNDFDGCRVETIAKAFPITIEIIRKSEDLIIEDAAGLNNIELIDFKVHLQNPTKDQIPSFYLKEESQFDNYYKKQFLDSSGLFYKKINESGQLSKVIDHLLMVMKNYPKKFATRRAVIIIPNVYDGSTLSPLGLISIRCIPRFLDTKIKLNFSFTWRTVEALVGFPYSLYASVKFGQHITDLVKNQFPVQNNYGVEFGEITYIAYSLHMITDDYGQNIAKRIVDDASI